MPNSNNIPWGRVLVEGAAIVISILLAFGIDAWWQDRQERAEEQQVLNGLKDEFTLINDVLTSHKQQHLERLQALEELLESFDNDGTEPTPDVLTAALDVLVAPTTSDISNGTLHALLNSGRLEIFENTTLRKHLVGWESAIEEVWDDQQSHAKLVYEIHVPYFIGEGFGMGDVLAMWYGDGTSLVRSIGEDPAEIDRLLADRRFRSMVETCYLYKLHLTEEFDGAIGVTSEILAEINNSIR